MIVNPVILLVVIIAILVLAVGKSHQYAWAALAEKS
jgi:hypothetical protein